ncbi:hypothetical protein BGZ46_003626 [Entomortierella lignicola]|nr:hypothetical protein BGZ46_003626 [Entomortierella lignicola]
MHYLLYGCVGFYPLASADEECAIDGTDKVAQITTDALDALCKNVTGYVAADKQQPPSGLAPALASATSISLASPTPTASTTGSGNPSSAAGMVTASSQNLMMVVASFVAVVLATAIAF